MIHSATTHTRANSHTLARGKKRCIVLHGTASDFSVVGYRGGTGQNEMLSHEHAGGKELFGALQGYIRRAIHP